MRLLCLLLLLHPLHFLHIIDFSYQMSVFVFQHRNKDCNIEGQAETRPDVSVNLLLLFLIYVYEGILYQLFQLTDNLYLLHFQKKDRPEKKIL